MNKAYARICGASMALAFTASAALAGAADYRFEIVSTDHRVGPDAVIEMRLTYLRTGAAVAETAICATCIDMAPDRMASMTTLEMAVRSDVRGTYRFATDLTMAGGWRYSVAAKVQGEPETVATEIELRVES